MPAPRTENPAALYHGCLATATRALDRAVTALYDDALRPLGLRSTQLTLLVWIAAMDRPTPSDIAPRMRIDQTTLSRNTDRLASAGLIDITPDAADARLRRLALTPAGRRLLARALPVWRRCQKRLRARLGADLSARLLTAAARLDTEPTDQD